MQVYLIAAEDDAAVAAECEEFLRRHGCMVRVELGASFYSPARPGELTLALWSLKTRMSARQIMFTNCAIDALMSGSLIVGQLDHHPLPYGLTDIEAHDLRAPGMRKLRFNLMLAEMRKIQRGRLMASVPKRDGDEEDFGGGVNIVDEAQGRPTEADRGEDAVFVSYAFANSEIVFPLIDQAKSLGANFWIDRTQLKPGTQWAGDIVRAIKSSDKFCLMCSAQSFASDHVRREIYLADKYKKPMLPVLLDDALMPEDIEYFLIDRQWLDLAGIQASDHSAALITALST